MRTKYALGNGQWLTNIHITGLNCTAEF